MTLEQDAEIVAALNRMANSFEALVAQVVIIRTGIGIGDVIIEGPPLGGGFLQLLYNFTLATQQGSTAGPTPPQQAKAP